jgi:predicted ATPase/class 3 adenylate cyclase
MICPKCQTDLPDGAKFCKECGQKLEMSCPECGNSIPPDSKFCLECGYDLRKPREISAVNFQQPKSYTPKHLADKILNTRSALEGERKLVTVMFADVAGFTAISEKLDPEDVHGIMDGCCRILVDEIHRFEGTVGEFRGDGLMALFGAPIAHEDHAQRACHAALAIQQALITYKEEMRQRYGIDFRMRIGLNSGLVVVGSIGDDLRMDYTAMGDTTNLAARMETAAEPGSVLVSGSTHRLAKEFFEFTSSDPLQVKGKQEPVEAYTLLHPTEVDTRIGASVAKGLTRFVGRRREIETLRETFAKVQSGEGQVVGLVGEAGVGKSRLLLEFRSLVPQREYTYLDGQCLHYGGSMPYLPLLDILRSFLGIKEGEPERVIRGRIEERILGLDEKLKDLIPPFQELLSLKVDDEAYSRLEPKEKREKIFEAFRYLLIRSTRDRPLVLALEDLHWVDQTSEQFLDYMIGWLPRTRILLLLLYRPEYVHQWGSKSYYSMIGVGQLSTNTSAELLGAILEGGEVVTELKDLILNRAAGNPLFMEELTQTLLQNGSIRKTEDRFVLTRDISSSQVPDTVQGIIAARMDRLDESLKRIMQVAAVIGREFAFRILETITEMKDNLKSDLVNLQGLEFIYEKSLFPELEYIFRHALVQEVAYNSLLITRRKEIHGKIGQAIEELYSQRLEEQVPILAYHYIRSDQQNKTIKYALLAGDQAAGLYANTEATTYYEQAFAISQTLPVSPQVQQWQIDAALKLAAVGITRQDIDRDRRNLEQAHTLAEELNDERRLAQVLYWLGRIYYVLWSPKIAMEYARKSLEIADRMADDALAAPPINLIGRVYYQLADFRQASRFLERSIEQMRRIGNKVEESTASAFAGYLLAHLGEFGRALAHANHGIQLAQEVQNPFAEANAYHFRGCNFDQRGEWTRAIADYEKAIIIAEKAEDLFRLYMVKSWIGRAHAIIGEPVRGRELLEESSALAEKIGTKFWLAWQKAAHAACLCMLGEFERGAQLCQEAIHLGEETNDRYAIAFANRPFAEILSHLEPSDPEKADRAIFQSIRIQQEIDAKPELARSYVSYAHMLAGRGTKEKAKEYLAMAIGMFQQMGMAWDLSKANQLLRNLEI